MCMEYTLYVITDEAIAGGRSHATIAREAVRGGAGIIQLRGKGMSGAELAAAGRELRAITKRGGAALIVNDRLDVAIACGADGVHLGRNDMPVGTARQLAPPGFIIGASVGSAAEAAEAVRAGADYVAASPVFATTSKDDAGPGCGLDGLREIRRAVAVPVIAVGGIGPEDVDAVVQAGADGIAVISAVVAAPDIARAARELKGRVLACRRGAGRRTGAGKSTGGKKRNCF